MSTAEIDTDFDQSPITGYHAHIYYDPASRETAARIREALGARFEVELGRWREEPVGPHPQSMYQVKFAPAQFALVVPWLMLNRDGLDVLVHPSTEDAYADHSHRAMWLGEKLVLRLDGLDSPR
ncbi:MAG: DOPA 4,5-dioxygenase family protein [Alphaproteobacteria bacterium]|jgi:DOPA 4,5-dioxygenase|nr:DOPA 4,5-dioxygenase family protein [Alphaproteobacteria bacterium]MDP6516664.1 DOPA 4,5-dioxygenase family protein [Alphaproteobacteria bacterium]